MGVWQFLISYPAVLAALITFALTVGWQLITRVFAPRPSVTWGITNHSVLRVPFTPPATEEEPEPAQRTNAFYVRNLWLWNGGRALAEDVELLFNWKPQHVERYPQLKAGETFFEDGRYLLTLERVNPREGVNFSMLSLNVELPEAIHVRAKGFPARQVTFMNQRRFPAWLNFFIAAIMLLGVFAAVYLSLLVIRLFIPIA